MVRFHKKGVSNRLRTAGGAFLCLGGAANLKFTALEYRTMKFSHTAHMICAATGFMWGLFARLGGIAAIAENSFEDGPFEEDSVETTMIMVTTDGIEDESDNDEA